LLTPAYGPIALALYFPKMKKLTHAIHEAMNVGIEVVDMLIEGMVEIVNRHRSAGTYRSAGT
jgi:hypothetical protein